MKEFLRLKDSQAKRIVFYNVPIIHKRQVNKDNNRIVQEHRSQQQSSTPTTRDSK